MRYKVGDKVRIKSMEWYEKNKNESGCIKDFVGEMSKYCGCITTITKITDFGCDSWYRLLIDHDVWNWSDEMFDENYKDMEERNTKIDIDTARKWYNGEYDSLKEIALQAFSEEELTETEVKVWDDLLKLKEKRCGFFICRDSSISLSVNVVTNSDKNVFIDDKHAKSALAMAQISQLMPYYGGRITDEEWGNRNFKQVIKRVGNEIKYLDNTQYSYNFLAFHTIEQRNEFLKNNEQLVKDYFMLD